MRTPTKMPAWAAFGLIVAVSVATLPKTSAQCLTLTAVAAGANRLPIGSWVLTIAGTDLTDDAAFTLTDAGGGDVPVTAALVDADAQQATILVADGLPDAEGALTATAEGSTPCANPTATRVATLVSTPNVGSVELGDDMTFNFASYEDDDGDMAMAAFVEVTGGGGVWLGLGPSPQGSMTGVDAAIAVPNTAEGIRDTLATQQNTPPQDTVNNFFNDLTLAVDGNTVAYYSRKFDTGDTQDHPISEDGATQWVYAYGTTTGFQYHGSSPNRGPFSLDVAPGACDPSTTCSGHGTCSGNAAAPCSCSGSYTGDSCAVCNADSCDAAGDDEYPLSADLDDKLTLNWKIDGDNINVKLELVGEGWIAMAVSQSSTMTGSPTPVAVIGVPADDTVGVYQVEAKDADAILAASTDAAGGAFDVSGASIEQAGGLTTVKFTRPLVGGAEGSDISSEVPTKMIFAYGSGNTFAYHEARIIHSVDFSSGSAEDEAVARPAIYWVHGLLMLTSWGFMLPLGAVMAYFWKHQHPWRFFVHRGLQVTGFTFSVIGVACAFIMVEGRHFHQPVHSILGILVTVGACTQLANAVKRPHPVEHGGDADKRAKWFKLHSYTGWLLVVIAPINVLFGIWLLEQMELFAVLGVFWLIIIVQAVRGNMSKNAGKAETSTTNPAMEANGEDA